MNIIGRVRDAELPDRRRPDRHGGHPGQGRGRPARARRRSVTACATHAVLSGPALERIAESKIREVVFTNSIPLSRQALPLEEDPQSVGGAAAGERHPVDPRGDVGQYFVCMRIQPGHAAHVHRTCAPAGGV